MTMIQISPLHVAVACDPTSGRPRSVRTAGMDLPVLAIERVRDESAAYPIGSGPRTVFDVRTGRGRLRLVFLHRDRRWRMEGVDTVGRVLPSAA